MTKPNEILDIAVSAITPEEIAKLKTSIATLIAEQRADARTTLDHPESN